jgi:hypothetical protein
MRFRDVLMLLIGIAMINVVMGKTKLGNAVQAAFTLFSNATRGLRNNNPGNIEKGSTKYLGEIDGADERFKTFSTIEYGYRAIYVLLDYYKRKYGLNTIDGIINRYAPGHENNTAAYISFVASKVGVSPTAKLDYTKDQFKRLVGAIAKMENGKDALPQHLEDGYNLFLNS